MYKKIRRAYYIILRFFVIHFNIKIDADFDELVIIMDN